MAFCIGQKPSSPPITFSKKSALVASASAKEEEVAISRPWNTKSLSAPYLFISGKCSEYIELAFLEVSPPLPASKLLHTCLIVFTTVLFIYTSCGVSKSSLHSSLNRKYITFGIKRLSQCHISTQKSSLNMWNQFSSTPRCTRQTSCL